MYQVKPEPYLIPQDKLGPMSYVGFAPRLRNLAVNHFGIRHETLLPAKSICSDESEGQVAIALTEVFGSHPFDFGRVGGVFSTDRFPAAAHHGKSIVCVMASHVGYDPAAGRYGRIFRPKMGTKGDPHAYSTCCGKAIGTIRPFQEKYDLVKSTKVNLVGKRVNGDVARCIVINNNLLSPRQNGGCVLTLELEKMIGHTEAVEARANSTVYLASEASQEYLAARTGGDISNLFREEVATPVGDFLTHDYFNFEATEIPPQEDGSHIVHKNLLPYMDRIVTSKIPPLTTAQILVWKEFGLTVGAIRENPRELDIEERTLLLIAGVNIDVYDHEMAEENPLLGHQVYFCPMAAYFREKGSHKDSVLEREEITDHLEKQPTDVTRFSLDQLAKKNPKRLQLSAA